jgi:pimeloyl-ACP methyl ester carboxylesterase
MRSIRVLKVSNFCSRYGVSRFHPPLGKGFVVDFSSLPVSYSPPLSCMHKHIGSTVAVLLVNPTKRMCCDCGRELAGFVSDMRIGYADSLPLSDATTWRAIIAALSNIRFDVMGMSMNGSVAVSLVYWETSRRALAVTASSASSACLTFGLRPDFAFTGGAPVHVSVRSGLAGGTFRGPSPVSGTELHMRVSCCANLGTEMGAASHECPSTTY